MNEIGSGSIENKSPRPTIKSGNLHFIDRVNMAFELEMCIMPKDLMFTLMRVSGNLPRLHLNFSDRKYRAVMNAVGMITSSLSGLGGGGDATTAVIGSADGSPLSTTSGGGVGAATAAANAAGAASYQDGHQWPELLVPSAAIDPQHDDLTVDTDGSEFFDAPEAITEDGFSDTAEYPTMNTSTGVTAAKSFDKNTAASSAMSQAKLILLKSSKIIVEFYFHVSEASASLKKYNSSSRTATSGLSLDIPSTFTPSPAIIADLVTGSETDLADICVYDFDLKYILRQYDTTYNIQIGNAIIEDKMQSSDSPFKYLLSKKSTSCEDSAGSSDSVKNGDDQLIKIMYKNMNKPSPDYIGVDQAVEVGFGSTDLIITRNSILTLYDYVLTTFSYASAPASSASNQDLPVAATTPLPITAPTTPAVASNILANLPPIATAADGGHSSSFTAPPNSAHLATSSSTSFIAVSSTHPKSNTMTVELSMKSTKIIFNKDGCHIATSVFDDGLISITMKTKTMLVTGKLRDIKIFDELPRSKESKFPDRYRQFVSIQGGEAANFVYETFNKLDYENYPGYDSALTFIASSLRMTYVEEFYVQFMNYLNEFQKMHFLLEAARKAAYDSAAQIQETAGGRFHFNVQMQTPILVFPDPSLLSEKSMTMYLGKLTAMNNFTELDPVKYGAERPVLIDEISATLQSMKLTSSDGFSTPDREMADIEVLEDVHIDYYWQRFNINLDRISKNEAIKPDSEVSLLFRNMGSWKMLQLVSAVLFLFRWSLKCPIYVPG